MRTVAVALLAVLALTCAASVSRAASTPTKAGIASSRYLSSDPQRLSDLGASWSYNWSAQAPPTDPRLQWVPMVWGSGSITPQVLLSLRRARRSGTAHYLLGFNEPDAGSQSNITPEQAAALWPKLESTGLELGSPAPAVPTDGWLAQFMKLAKRRGLRVNFIALHYYQDFTNPGAVSQLRAQLTAIYKAYRKPIWITEIGALNIRSWGEPMLHAATETRAVTYMRQLFEMLNALPFVERYAWFTDNCSNDPNCATSTLFNARNQLTPMGRAFKRDV
jgi:hypothetical protein